MTEPAGTPLRAAGAVVVRSGPDGPELLLVHRPRYDDWSLPKGKLHRGEAWPVAAVRETREETGLDVRLGPPAGTLHYRVKGRPKEVRLWRATAHGDPDHRSGGTEVDESDWFPLDTALDMLGHDDEREVARSAGALGPTVPLVIARHGKARARSKWRGTEPGRPLASRGNGQALRLITLLSVWSPGTVLSSPSRRCVDTVQPYAASIGSSVTLSPLLSEEEHADHPDALVDLLHDTAERLRKELVRDESFGGAEAGAVLCTHRPLLPTIADTLRIPIAAADREEALPTGGCWVVHLAADGAAGVEQHRV